MEVGGGSIGARVLRRPGVTRLRPHLALLVLATLGCGSELPQASDGVREAALAAGAVPVPSGSEGADGASRRGGEALSAGPEGSALPPPSASGRVGIRRVGEAPPSDPSPQDPPQAPPSFTRPEHVRGIYLTAWTAGSSRRMEQLIELARVSEINSFVIDLKDASGYVSHDTRVPLARQVGATGERRIGDLPGLLRRLEAEGIYPIARIVIVQDPVLVAARPDLAVQEADGGVWIDGKGIRWLNPHHREVWDYHVALAREAAQLGFPEIQWDYVRFPDAPRAELARAVYPGSGGEEKSEVIRAFLTYARERLDELDVEMTADVFGVTTSAGDVGIGQIWERFIDVVDVALPMVYPSHYYRGSFGIERPNAYPYEIVRRALEYALRRSDAVQGAGAVRPWLQDFTLGEPSYGPAEVRAQIQATYDAGIEEWVLWNPASRYTREALAPEGGFGEPPQIRVAGRIVPASDRFEALGEGPRSVPASREVPAPAAPARPVTDAAPAAMDSLLRRDTIPGR